MDNQPADDSMISRESWPVVLWLSRWLEQSEREAVLGDLIEYGGGGGGSIANVLGLVVRRRTAVFLEWKLWVAVLLIVLPLSYLLSAVARTAAGLGAAYSWMYLNNWDWALTRDAGFWYVLRETATQFGITCLVLACWSWSGGFLMGLLPKAILRASRNAFIVLLASFQFGEAPARVFQFWMHFRGLPLSPPMPDVNAPITANVFYRVFCPWIVLAILVALPALSGIRQGRSLPSGWKMRVILPILAAISLLILLTQAPGFGLLFGAAMREWLWRNRNAVQMLPILCCWPMFYFTAVGFRRYRRGKAAVAQIEALN